MKKFELTPKMARIIYKATHYISVVCGIMGGILAIGAAGTSDFYSEIHQAVPDNQDMKLITFSYLDYLELLGEFLNKNQMFRLLQSLKFLP